ncbi:type II toxin-antitoxin system PemK/MazF family toxin [Brevundimonas sp. Root1423]|uniref:type II toxin-antitoxin system PemK/MazF family toxin n=1 Tax=Brevundimonas sp. Root1423 TaxID=1736462 RepID=UPI0012E3D944|nr:type II toxin-antitoxin system PemK/MazF family toxin [Brevundimonas sp. Root1423]
MSSAGEVELDWWGPGTIPAPLSIVWCAFPDHIAPKKPGPKNRPALVLSVRFADNPPEQRHVVRVIYGTSKLKSDNRPYDFSIENYGTRLICRLPQATRFDLDQVLWLPWAKPYFVARDNHDTPVVSVLPMSVQQDFAWLMHARDKAGLNDHLKC